MFKGAPFPNCKEDVNGSPCGVKHHHILHGTQVKYANYLHVNTTERRSSNEVPTLEEINANDESNTLMQVQEIPVKDQKPVFGIL